MANEKELHIAPMLNYSNRDFRFLLRILTKRAVLWTEMVVDDTIVNNSKESYLLDGHLGYNNGEHPIVCQLGGNSPELAAACASIILEDYDYDELNINCGCPSNKVANQREFGASLMKQPHLVKDIVASIMQQQQRKQNHNDKNKPVSVKTRIGIAQDDTQQNDFDPSVIIDFIETLQPICNKVILHARNVCLHGFSARQNRSIPPLNYPFVYKICEAFPNIEFYINGGIKTLQDAKRICYGINQENTYNNNQNHTVPCLHCQFDNGSCVAPPAYNIPNLKGCMLGRAAIDNPSIFWDVDRYFYGEQFNPCKNRHEVLLQYCQYLATTYPRRCCDDDSRITYRYPSPDDIKFLRDYCPICQPMIRPEKENPSLSHGFTIATPPKQCNQEHQQQQQQGIVHNKNTNNANAVDALNKIHIPQQEKLSRFHKRCPGQKISSKLIGQALKPLHGLFAGLPCNKKFKQFLDIQDKSALNCGPAFILWRAMQAIPPEFLHQPFASTEKLIIA